MLSGEYCYLPQRVFFLMTFLLFEMFVLFSKTYSKLGWLQALHSFHDLPFIGEVVTVYLKSAQYILE